MYIAANNIFLIFTPWGNGEGGGRRGKKRFGTNRDGAVIRALPKSIEGTAESDKDMSQVAEQPAQEEEEVTNPSVYISLYANSHICSIPSISKFISKFI